MSGNALDDRNKASDISSSGKGIYWAYCCTTQTACSGTNNLFVALDLICAGSSLLECVNENVNNQPAGSSACALKDSISSTGQPSCGIRSKVENATNKNLEAILYKNYAQIISGRGHLCCQSTTLANCYVTSDICAETGIKCFGNDKGGACSIYKPEQPVGGLGFGPAACTNGSQSQSNLSQSNLALIISMTVLGVLLLVVIPTVVIIRKRRKKTTPTTDLSDIIGANNRNIVQRETWNTSPDA